MTIAAALAITGGVFLALAAIGAMVSGESGNDLWGWLATGALALAVICFISAPWIEVLA